jgi:hypothetical protein
MYIYINIIIQLHKYEYMNICVYFCNLLDYGWSYILTPSSNSQMQHMHRWPCSRSPSGDSPVAALGLAGRPSVAPVALLQGMDSSVLNLDVSA